MKNFMIQEKRIQCINYAPVGLKTMFCMNDSRRVLITNDDGVLVSDQLLASSARARSKSVSRTFRYQKNPS